MEGRATKDENLCVPVLPKEGSSENHFYDDKHKFHVCLPTKTGSTNWLKALLSLYAYNGLMNPEEVDANLVYKIPQMPRFGNELHEFIQGRQGKEGYFTMISVRHPLARLYSAWKDKFRIGHPWFVYIKERFGHG